MKKIVLTLFLIIAVSAALFFGKKYVPQLTNDNGQLTVNSSPKTTVFINGDKKDETPFVGKLKPGTYELQLVPESDTSASTWQQQVTVNKGVETNVNVNLGPTDNQSSWQIITIESTNKGTTEVAVFSNADTGELFIDGERKGTTPLTLPNISEGVHELRILAPGYAEMPVNFTVTKNYKIQVNTQLAKLDLAGEDQTASNSATTATGGNEPASQKVKILSTPTGWLRVRSDPSTSKDEVTKVKPGEEYPYVEESNGWYKIEYETGKTGWISGDYAQKVE